jgi:peroxiredoxin
MSPDDQLHQIPPDLPVPVDDGACNHLPGHPVPAMSLQATTGGRINLSQVTGRVIVYCSPRTGTPGQPPSPEWDAIPGARGCTPEACAFRDHHEELQRRGVTVFGLSTQSADAQREFARREHLPFPLLSDADLEFVRALRLTTFEFGGMTLVKRLTLVIDGGRITHVFYPVFPPQDHPEEVLAWLDAQSE